MSTMADTRVETCDFVLHLTDEIRYAWGRFRKLAAR